MAYSLLGLSDPTQWGIGGNDSFITRFGASMQRGMKTGDDMNKMVMAQQTRQATQPYYDRANIAAARNATGKYELGQLDNIRKEPARVCAAQGWTSAECQAFANREVQSGRPDPRSAAMGALAPTQALDGRGAVGAGMAVAGGNIMSFGGNNQGYLPEAPQTAYTLDDQSMYTRDDYQGY